MCVPHVCRAYPWLSCGGVEEEGREEENTFRFLSRCSSNLRRGRMLGWVVFEVPNPDALKASGGGKDVEE